MSLLPQPPASGRVPELNHPRMHQRPLSVEEQQARWEVRAAQWRARELAEYAFGGVGETSLVSLRPDGPLRGLLSLTVPFADLADHREREARFLAAVERDSVLTRVPLVFVIGPHVG